MGLVETDIFGYLPAFLVNKTVVIQQTSALLHHCSVPLSYELDSVQKSGIKSKLLLICRLVVSLSCQTFTVWTSGDEKKQQRKRLYLSCMEAQTVCCCPAVKWSDSSPTFPRISAEQQHRTLTWNRNEQKEPSFLIMFPFKLTFCSQLQKICDEKWILRLWWALTVAEE